jgi:predicted transposase/invertase (TIGR01784 family)
MRRKERYINPFTDFGFKKLLVTEPNKVLLVDFLNQVLGDRERIRDLTYLNTENQGRTETDRKAIFDLYCENESGEKFIIELQNVPQAYFKDRSIYYATFPIREQATRGAEWDYALKAVYTIGILNFRFPDKPKTERYVREVQLLDKHTFEVFFDKLTFIYLEIPRFRKREDELVTPFDKWLYVLKHLHKLQNKPQQLQEEVFEKLFAEAELIKLSPEEMNSYDESLKVYWDNKNTMDYAIKTATEKGEKKGEKKGFKKGLQAGLQAGLQEGRQEGRQAGLEEAMTKAAREMKKEGLPPEQITRITGLSPEQVAQL